MARRFVRTKQPGSEPIAEIRIEDNDGIMLLSSRVELPPLASMTWSRAQERDDVSSTFRDHDLDILSLFGCSALTSQPAHNRK
jgi:hypothetical protein